ncbi:MAG: hypothetical protein IPM54_39775 [Polyangiaceae bacterium]|nr:hypothetical protein [Polyangiaceae bacterium]
MVSPEPGQRTLDQIRIERFDAIAREEMALARIIETEKSLLQKLATAGTSADDLIKVKREASRLLRIVMIFQILLELKLEDVKDLGDDDG